MATFESPRQVMQAWLDAVNAGDVGTVDGLYQDQAILLPTFSNRRLGKRPDRRAYFEQLGSRKGLSVVLHERTYVEQALSPQLHCLSGIYRWGFEVDEEALSFEARFTYVIDLSLEAPILHHHSSQVPRTL